MLHRREVLFSSVSSFGLLVLDCPWLLFDLFFTLFRLRNMATSTQDNTLFSVGVLPVLMGLGHLAPAMGAIRTATGSYQFPGAVLGMVGTAAALVDCKLNINT